MYKRDRARKLQVLRQRQVLQQSGTGGSGNPSGSVSLAYGAGSMSSSYTSPLHIKQEIQIPQVTSMTSSPDSSPSPVQLQQNVMSTAAGSSGSAAAGGSSSGGGSGGNNNAAAAVAAAAAAAAQGMAQQAADGGVQWQIGTQASKVRIIHS